MCRWRSHWLWWAPADGILPINTPATPSAAPPGFAARGASTQARLPRDFVFDSRRPGHPDKTTPPGRRSAKTYFAFWCVIPGRRRMAANHANHANCANRTTMEKANKRVRNEPRRAGLGVVRSHSGFYQKPRCHPFPFICHASSDLSRASPPWLRSETPMLSLRPG